ncbi:hypothetical protein BRDI103020_13500 [Brevundimonas diminuta]
MKTTRIALVRLGSARALTQLEPEGPFAEIGLAKTRNPV